MKGWIKLHRELIDKPIWIESTPEQKTVLITLLMMANHQDREWEWRGEIYKVQPGQFVTSLESIAQKCGKGVSVQNVRTSLKRFEKYGFLTNQSTNKNRLITIVNWGSYQGSDGQLTDHLTGNQQATNKQLTTNKNVKNDKNEKNKRYFDFKSIEGDSYFLEIYHQVFKEYFGTDHMQVSQQQLDRIVSWINSLEVTEEEFSEIVEYHFDNLPSNNNGNILAFIPAFRRYLDDG